MAAPQTAAVPSKMGAGFFQKYSDVIIALVIVTIVIMMIIPLPTILLDLLICLNITIALLVMMSTIYNAGFIRLPVSASGHDPVPSGPEYILDATHIARGLCWRRDYGIRQLRCRR